MFIVKKSFFDKFGQNVNYRLSKEQVAFVAQKAT